MAEHSRLVQLVSWNVWLIPNSCPFPSTRPAALGARICELLVPPSPHACPDAGLVRGLVVVCFQECWAWHAGLGKLPFWLCSLLAPHSLCVRVCSALPGAALACDVAGFLALLFALLSGLFCRVLQWLPGYQALLCWNPRLILAQALRPVGLCYPVGLEPIFGMPALYDSGLFMMSNRPCTRQGFLAFSQPSWATEERLANKGLLWGLWVDGPSSVATLVITLHARCASSMGDDDGGPEESEQERFVAELCQMLRGLMHQHRDTADTVEVYCVGDFNVPQASQHWSTILSEVQLHDLSTDIAGKASMINTNGSDGSATIDLAAGARLSSAAAAAAAEGKEKDGGGGGGGREEQEERRPQGDAAASSSALVDEWASQQVWEPRAQGAALPPPNTHAQWQYLSLRDVLSDHKAVVWTRRPKRA
jgi:hypothetical protein